MKIPNPHNIDHRHYKRCMFCGLFAVFAVHLVGGEIVGAFEALIGVFILYDPTGV